MKIHINSVSTKYIKFVGSENVIEQNMSSKLVHKNRGVFVYRRDGKSVLIV